MKKQKELSVKKRLEWLENQIEVIKGDLVVLHDELKLKVEEI